MSGFSNPLIAGDGTLLVDAIKSPNYVPAVSGWTVNEDGSAAFNNVTMRGSLEARNGNAVIALRPAIPSLTVNPNDTIYAHGGITTSDSAGLRAELVLTGPEATLGAGPTISLLSGLTGTAEVGTIGLTADTVTVNGNLTVSGVGQVRYVVAAALENVNNSAAPQFDNELFLPLVANASYEVEFWVYFQSAVDCDIRTAWTVPAGATGLKTAVGATDTAASYTGRQDTRMRIGVHAFGTEIGYQLQLGNFPQVCYERGIVTTAATAADLVFRWGQFTATVGDLTRIANSYMKVTRIA